MMNHASPIAEHEQEGQDYDDTNEESFHSNLWCCFSQSCFRRSQGYNGETKGLLGDERETWLGGSFRKAREISEIVAGPKWKNFIRKISKHFNRRTKKGHFQYDPQSYALNFSDGVQEEDDGLLPAFSTRFSGPINVEGNRASL